MPKSNNKLSYKKSIERLNEILEEINSEDLEIDKLATLIDESVSLVEFCKKTLHTAEEKVDKSLTNLEEQLNK